jgi:hypothetical protein
VVVGEAVGVPVEVDVAEEPGVGVEVAVGDEPGSIVPVGIVEGVYVAVNVTVAREIVYPPACTDSPPGRGCRW